MRHWMLFACGAVLVLAIISISHLYAQDLDKSIVSPAIPFELVSDFLVVVNVQIGNLDGLKFILDTGASRSVVDRKVADRLRLQRQAGKIMTFDRYIPIEWADISELRVGPIRAKRVQVMVVTLAEYSEFAKNVDGIIGLDLLSKSKKFIIDYERKTVYFQLADEGTSSRSLPGSFLVPIVVQGLPMRLIVDTGFQGILLYGDRVRKRLPNMHMEGESTTVTMGRIKGIQVKLRGVRIGGPEAVATVVLINGPDEGVLPGVDGYLGPPSLHPKRIEFDFAAMVLRWQ